MGTYQSAVLAGAADFAREQGLNLVCFAGGEAHSPYGFHSKRNILYRLVNANNVDGLVMLSSVLGNYVGVSGMEAFARDYAPLPVVSIGMPLARVPSVLIDNKMGMRAALNHLIEVHGHRRIVFIRGLAGSDEAEQRYQAYLETLAEHGINFDPAFVVNGDFFIIQTTQAMEDFLDRGIPFDAVAAANDEMAIAGIEVLMSRNICVPDRVAVVGFDDTEEARSVVAPLTTVHQPLYELGRNAVELLLHQLQERPVPEQMTLPTRLVVRQSCGCLPQAALRLAIDEIRPGAESVETVLRLHHDEIVSGMIEAAGLPARGIDTQDLEALFQAFASEFTSQVPTGLLTILDRIGRKIAFEGGDLAHLQNVVATLRRYMLPSLLHSGAAVSRMDSIWQQSQILIGEIIQRREAYHLMQVKQRTRTLTEIVRDMVSARTIEELADVAAYSLPRLGVEACYLSLYEGASVPSQWSRLILAYDQNGRIALEPGGRRFPTTQLIPDELLRPDRQRQLLVDPLYFKEEQIGLVVFEMSHYEAMLHDAITDPLSSIIKGLRIAEEHVRVEANLRQLDQLKTEFISTAAHELRTPLTSIQGFSEILLNRELDQTRQKRYLTLINQQSTQLATIVNDLLDVSRLESKRNLEFTLEPVNMAELITSVVTSMSETSLPHRIEIEGFDDAVRVIGDHFRLTQVVSNLLSNAIKYSPNGGTITVRGDVIARHLQISVHDPGIGMTPEQQCHLFEKFYRANASNTAIGGTGLGLSISKLVVELLDGKIWAESEQGVGSTFYFTLPLLAGDEQKSAGADHTAV